MGILLESSKSFAKEFCLRRSIPAPRFARFKDAEAAGLYLDEIGLPAVIEAEGAEDAICRTKEEAQAAIAARLSTADGGEIIVEEVLTGEEVGYSVVTDGNVVLPLTSTMSRWDGEATPSRRGCLSPAPAVTPEIERQIVERIFVPAVEGMKAERRMCKGLLSARIMLTSEGPKVLEFKVRFSDPESLAIILRIKGDLMPRPGLRL